MVPEGTLWEALEPLYLMHRRHIGRSRACSARQLFSDWVYRPSLDVSWGEFFEIWVDFGCPLGSLGLHLGVKLVSIFRVRFRMTFISKLAGAGGRGWAPGDLESAELAAELELRFKHARLPLKGGGEFKGFAPCRWPPTAKSKQLKVDSRLVNLRIADWRIGDDWLTG